MPAGSVTKPVENISGNTMRSVAGTEARSFFRFSRLAAGAAQTGLNCTMLIFMDFTVPWICIFQKQFLTLLRLVAKIVF